MPFVYQTNLLLSRNYCIPSGKSLILPETVSLMHVVLCIMCRLIDPACWQAPPSAYFLSEVRRVWAYPIQLMSVHALGRYRQGSQMKQSSSDFSSYEETNKPSVHRACNRRYSSQARACSLTRNNQTPRGNPPWCLVFRVCCVSQSHSFPFAFFSI